ncbi:asparagine--tRNA ligase [Desulfohalobiaceae bacterium Ax17]|uniref:asparagine--tRNA ligase n=1 Tax=Desulfovulcanus ferrireducens TaxID=2831190 RepID=UPI00207BA5F7|nr:asparagine--tRNA ligase [Desulfovulcanus ferrireducens]MBT8764427.1 asparagine--tRNA ligase [Desulfovulcanus ferrireducens]
MRTKIKDALNAIEPQDEILIKGWVRTKREAKGFSFLEINDGSCLQNLQVVVDGDIPTYPVLEKIGTGAAVKVRGSLVESPGKGQKWEVQAREVELIGYADPKTYPLQKKRHSDEFLRTIAHLRPRTNKYGAINRIRAELSFAIHRYFHDKGFWYIHTPILTGSDCEGAGEMFQVTTLNLNQLPKVSGQVDLSQDFFGKKALLTVSGQLEAEALACALGDVYTFGPTFRAENSNTPRHAAEFWMIEPEMAFADLEDDMVLAEDCVKKLVSYALKHCAQDLDLFARFVDKGLSSRLENILKEDFVRLSYKEAVSILKRARKKFEFPVGFGLDLQTEHERYLTEEYCKKPVIVYDYPKEIKAFYMRLNDDGQTVAAMDVLVPKIGELIGGSQREERVDVLESRLKDLGLSKDEYWWYLDLRRFGSVPHAGFGMGFERLLMFLTGVSNIRDVIPFPRTPKHLEF